MDDEVREMLGQRRLQSAVVEVEEESNDVKHCEGSDTHDTFFVP